ncbi:MAG: tetratricopeptide repeat protein [Acidobacteriota bacterium]
MGANSVKNVTAKSFETDVMQRSREIVVVIDFWAEWCGPCKTLAPVLEAAIAKFPGKIEMVKVDCDTEQELAAAFAVSGIPAVKAIKNGQLINEFTGAQPPHVVDAWVRSLVPSEEETALAAAKREVAEGRRNDAIGRLQRFLEQNPNDSPVLLELGRQLSIAGRNREALEIFARIPEGAPEFEQVRQEQLLIEMMASAETAGGLAGALRACGDRPNDLEARFALSGARWQGGDISGAIDELLQIFRTDRAFRDDGARRTLLAIFEHLGADHPETVEGRTRLANLLFA